eukprot:scaffold5682_cov140-Cylindrotheca_fusiformis.AAC.2
MWLTSYCLSSTQEDWLADSSDSIVENTLRRDYLLIKLQELEDSKSGKDAEAALRAIDAAVSTDDTRFLKFLEQAGALPIIYKVLRRKEGKPSPLVAASLLCKFAKHQIGFRQTSYGNLVALSTKPRHLS